MEVALKGETINYKMLWDTLAETLECPAPEGLWRRRTGTLMYRVSQLNKLNEEPLLSALVVLKETGEVSDGYKGGVEARYGYMPSDIELHAEAERLKIARWLGV